MPCGLDMNMRPADKVMAVQLWQMGICWKAGPNGKCSKCDQGGSTQQEKGPGGWPSQNPGMNSGKGRDNNPPKYK